ncbi:MAG: NAD-binding protein, partial [SAR324 cluster bacterium]|nr:NAD-binding protein [SAR324 cluster bacterium]
ELLQKNVDIKIIEKDADRAEVLAAELKNTQILNGDGTDANVLIMAGLLDMESFIATTGENETNIVSCLLAKHLMNKQNRDPRGTQGKTIALVNKEDYLVLAATIGLDVALSAKISAANEILKFIRRSEFLSVAHLHGVDVEVVELEASAKSAITKKPVSKFSSFGEQGILVGGIIRNDQWHLATSDTQIESGDRVIMVCTSLALKEVQKMFY